MKKVTLMRFVDEVRLYVRAGKGGDGAIAFLRQKFKPFGGPAGGDGGHGGSVVFEVDPGLTTLLDLKFRHRLVARDGERGKDRDRNGRAGADLVARVPPGTVVFDEDTGATIGELLVPGERLVVARGGKGGLGNRHFATSTRRAPRIATPGSPGEERRIRVELRVIADVGLVGAPNAGKSTLLAALTAAHPRIAPYPFTTLAPNLGRVVLDRLGRGFTIADIPGLIEGAHQGRGLGIRFLRHLSRTRALVFVLDVSAGDPVATVQMVRSELRAFEPKLTERPSLVALNKCDLVEPWRVEEVSRKVKEATGLVAVAISAQKRRGLGALVHAILQSLAAENTTALDVAVDLQG